MATAILSNGGWKPQAKGDRHMLSMMSEDATMKQILATHEPDGSEFDVKPLVHVIENIMHHATPPIPGLDHVTQAQALTNQNGFSDTLELLANDINKISCEFSCKCSGGSDAHTTLALFNTLSRYSWDTKVVIALAAFAVNYGEFWLVVQSNPLAKSVALLKQLPDIHEQRDDVYLRPKFEALSNIIKAKLDVIKLIVKFREFPSQYITPWQMVAATTYFPIAVCWTIQCIVACAVLFKDLTGRGREWTTSTTEELASLAGMLNNIHSDLQEQWNYCNQIVDETKSFEAFQRLRYLFFMNHQDNTEIFKALIYDKDDQPPLVFFYGSTSTNIRVHIDVLKGKKVLLLISDLDISHEEFTTLHEMYTEARKNPTRPESEYEVVWLPIVDKTTQWNDTEQLEKFQKVQGTIPWFSVYHNTIPNPGVIKYIKEDWHFNRKPLLVVLDPRGRVVHPDATHMIMIWGSSAFPFTSQREKELRAESETMTSPILWLASFLYKSIKNWIGEEKYICLYGGGDLAWIKNFTATAKAVAAAAGISLEMIYVEKSKRSENVQKIIKIYKDENRSHILSDLTFWKKLESMCLFQMQPNKFAEKDPKLQEIMTVLTFDRGDQGWAMISEASGKMAKAKGDTILKGLKEFEKWKESIGNVGFVTALDEYLRQHPIEPHCNCLYLPGTTDSIPKTLFCVECGQSMEKFIIYRCCKN